MMQQWDVEVAYEGQGTWRWTIIDSADQATSYTGTAQRFMYAVRAGSARLRALSDALDVSPTPVRDCDSTTLVHDVREYVAAQSVPQLLRDVRSFLGLQ